MPTKKDLRLEIKRIQNWYGGNATEDQVASHLGITVEELRELTKEAVKKPPKAPRKPAKKPVAPAAKKPIPIIFIRIIASFLASLGALMSWFYSYEWSKNALPGFWKYILPLLIVGCASLFPEIALILLGKKGWKTKVASVFVFSTGLIATGFSMLSTVAGIYNANTSLLSKNTVAIVASNAYLEYKEERDRLRIEIDRLNKEIDSTQSKIDSIGAEDTTGMQSQTLMGRLNRAKSQKQGYEKDYAEISKKIEGIRETGNTAETVRADFSSFVGKVLGMDAGRVEFAMASAPALLIDIVVPILMAVALFL